MMAFAIGQALPTCEITAHNYAADVENRIHSDAGAAEHGFEGALVPGVGVYAYLTHPVVAAFGRDWLERGAMSAKFLKPVYDRDRVRAQATVAGLDPLALDLELRNAGGTLCAVGAASLPATPLALDPAAYPRRPRGPLRPATIASIQAGEFFGTVEFTLDLRGEVARFCDNMVDGSPIYRSEGICHPAYWLAQANEVVMQNVALGMWIHTESAVRHGAIARDGETISLRSRVIEAFEKRGHELITLDIGVFGERDRPLLHIRHTAIIKLRG
jgi:acyl dehydratase